MKTVKQGLFPILIFITTVVIGVVGIVVNENIYKQKITTTTKASYSYPCEVFCPGQGNGTMKCTCTKSDNADPWPNCGLENRVCEDTCPKITETPPPDTTTPPERQLITETPQATNTPAVTKSPTPSPSVTASPTPTASPTKTPTPSPSATPSPTAPPHACGYSPCNDTTNPCAAGLSCIKASDNKYYCSQPSYVTACTANPSVASCCSAPTATPVPQACGYTQCDSDHPCQNGLECVTAKNDKSYCAKPEYKEACRNNNGDYNSCCNAPGPTATNVPGATNTPTEIQLAKATNTPPAPTLPSAGVPVAWVFVAAPLLLVALGLLF